LHRLADSGTATIASDFESGHSESDVVQYIKTNAAQQPCNQSPRIRAL
jgi:hypothetical protein